MSKNRGVPISAERLELVRLATDDKWPIWEIIETHHVSYDTIRKYFPDYKPFTMREAGGFSAIKKRARKLGI